MSYILEPRIKDMPDLEELSEYLFGRTMRLPVARVILEDDEGIIFQSAIAESTGYKATYVKQEMVRLERLGMIRRLPDTPGSRRHYYVRIEGPLWTVVRSAVNAAAAGPSNEPPSAATPGPQHPNP